jgi:PadR family transcriptional regulator, regulatory protein AphA
MSTDELTATGFVLLAQIAREPISPYRLTQLMRNNIHYLWPRAESRIYSELNRLEASGYLHAEKSVVGRRTRSILRVTDSGHAAIRHWIERPIAPGIALQSESLIRTFFATLGTTDDFRRALLQIQSDGDDLSAVARLIGDQYLAGGGSAHEQAHVRVMIHELLAGFGQLLQSWATQNLQTIGSWQDLKPDDKLSAAMEHFNRTQVRMKRTRNRVDSIR